jgi:hypothetical protein
LALEQALEKRRRVAELAGAGEAGSFGHFGENAKGHVGSFCVRIQDQRSKEEIPTSNFFQARISSM